ncbi:MAG: class II aldolase/adducin family protein [Anaerolineales bacterium]|nr:class II aldolase/adducin family protein [Anaerolineales bacterium]
MNELRFSKDASELDLRRAIVACGRLAYERGLLMSNDGNISVRLDERRLLITPSGLCKGRLAPEDLLICDLNGRLLQPAADPALRLSGETPMHIEAYRRRPDIRAVLHAHPPYAVALTVAGKPLRHDVVWEVALGLGEVPTTRFALPISDDNARAISDLIVNHNAVLLRNHGSLTVGAHLDEALIHLERVESVAQILYLAETLGKVTPLPRAMLPKLYDLRAQLLGELPVPTTPARKQRH